MQVMTCTVRRQELNVSAPSLVALSYDYINVTANFSTEWNDIQQKWFHCRSVSDPSIRGDVLFDENDTIGEDEGLNLGAGDWEIWIHGSTYVGDTLTKRITTNVKVIHVAGTGDSESILPDVGPSVAEQAIAAMEQAQESAQDAEAWAVGTIDGTPVESTDTRYHNNSKYWAEQSAASAVESANEATTAQRLANNAQGYSYDAEAWAKGTRDGTPVSSGTDGYHDNSKYYKDESESAADEAAKWAVGTDQAGTPVTSGDAQYQNNAKYYAELEDNLRLNIKLSPFFCDVTYQKPVIDCVNMTFELPSSLSIRHHGTNTVITLDTPLSISTSRNTCIYLGADEKLHAGTLASVPTTALAILILCQYYQGDFYIHSLSDVIVVGNRGSNDNIPLHTKMRDIAHACYHADGSPMNSIPAIISTKKHGYEWFECDVRKTSDGTWVLVHDETINSMARIPPEGTELQEDVYIANITYAQALEYTFSGSNFSNYPELKITTLEECLKCARDNNLKVRIEFKTELNATNCKQIDEMVNNCGMRGNVEYHSGIYNTVYAMAKLTTGNIISYMLGTSVVAITDSIINDVKQLCSKPNRINISVASAMPKSEMDKLTVYGWSVSVRTENTLAGIANLPSNVSAVTSDYRHASWILTKALGGYDWERKCISDSFPYLTESGSATGITFNSVAYLPLKSTIVEMLYNQESGTPTPSSPLAITPFSKSYCTLYSKWNGDSNSIEIPYKFDFGETKTGYGFVIDYENGTLTEKYKVLDLKSVAKADWKRYSTNIFYLGGNDNKAGVAPVACSHFTIATYGTIANNLENYQMNVGISASASHRFHFKVTDADTVDDFYTWLQALSGDVLVVYEADNPTVTEYLPIEVLVDKGSNTIRVTNGTNVTVQYPVSVETYVAAQNDLSGNSAPSPVVVPDVENGE